MLSGGKDVGIRMEIDESMDSGNGGENLIGLEY
jgi:hypothetical protein